MQGTALSWAGGRQAPSGMPQQQCLYPGFIRTRDTGGWRGPGHPFGPQSVPPATSTYSVVYWPPGPYPGPTPAQRASAADPSDAAPAQARNVPPTGRDRRARMLDSAATYPRSPRCQPSPAPLPPPESGASPFTLPRSTVSYGDPGPRCPRAVRLSLSQRCEGGMALLVSPSGPWTGRDPARSLSRWSLLAASRPGGRTVWRRG